MKNQLLTSNGKEKAARQFFDIYDNPFGWKTVKEQWRRDEKRVSNHLFPNTDLVMGSIYPDVWNKMSVKPSKPISSHRTICEGFAHFSNELGCLNQMVSGHEMVEDVRLLNVGRCHILNHLANTSGNVSLHVKSGIAELTYRAHVGCLFNETFMNRHRKLERCNFSDEKQKIKKILNYFKYWNECKHERSKKTDLWGDKLWEKSFMSDITFGMLITSVEGFLDYAHFVLGEEFANYIPYLHSNSSVIESFFSVMRAHNADTPHGYIHACGVVDVTKANDYLNNNKMYEKCDETCIGNLTDVRLGHHNLKRNMVIEKNCVRDSEKDNFLH